MGVSELYKYPHYFGRPKKLTKFFTSTYIHLFQVRSFISDFSVIIAIAVMVTVDVVVGFETPKLLVPESFQVSENKNQHHLVQSSKQENVMEPSTAKYVMGKESV